MTKILYGSEVGNGYAYVEGLIYGGKYFKKAGYDVALALRNLAGVERLVHGRIPVYQAPTAITPPRDQLRQPMTFADLLHNAGFGDAERMLGQVRAWRLLLDAVKPDILRLVHSPGALLAARGLGIPTMVVGTGFLIPPPVSPLPNLRPWNTKANPEAMLAREQRVLGEFNKVLEALKAPPLKTISDLYAAEVTEIWGYRELDEYGARDSAEYLGIYQPRGDAAPQWPQGGGKRVFAYLAPAKGLPEVLDALQNSGCSVLAFVPGLPEELRVQHSSPTMAFAPEPVDVVLAAERCDYGVSHGGHNIASSFLMAGKPQLAMPRFLPERITAANVAKLGAGLMGGFNGLEAAQALHLLREREPALGTKAQEFAARHWGENLEWSMTRVMELIGRVAKGGTRTTK